MINLSEEQRTVCEEFRVRESGDCLGVDLNRNFPSGWGRGQIKISLELELRLLIIFTRGTGVPERIKQSLDSSVPRTQTYFHNAEPQPSSDQPLITALSEPESLALHRHIQTVRDSMLTAISIHSYGKDIFYPKVCPLINH